MLERLPEDFYPGRFNIAGPGLACSAERFGILAFSSRYGHAGGLGQLLEDLPLSSLICCVLPTPFKNPELNNYEYEEQRE
jgi:hypothetical protein